MKAKDFKAVYHGALALAAVFEFSQAQTRFRKALAGGFAGFHVALLLSDVFDEEEKEPLFIPPGQRL